MLGLFGAVDIHNHRDTVEAYAALRRSLRQILASLDAEDGIQ